MYHRYMKPFKEDSQTYSECSITGTVPEWLSGSLLRNGAAMYTIGSDEYLHMFDGLAALQQYKLENGKVLYRNRLIETEVKDRCLAAQRIVVTEFGTTAYPDPCKSIFTRYFSYYTESTRTDNTCVNVLLMGDQLYALSEGPRVKRIKPSSLETLGEVDTQKILSLHLNTAHPLQEKDGTTYNLGSRFGKKSSYVVFKSPPAQEGDADPYAKAEVFATIRAPNSTKPSYYHSFAMSENYLIVIEQPLYLNLMKIIRTSLKLNSKGVADCLEYDPQGKTRFHIIRKETGEVISTKYEADPMFFFHTINAYEDGSNVIVDVAAFNDASIIDKLFLENIKKAEPEQEGFMDIDLAAVRRYMLPITEPTVSGDEIEHSIIQIGQDVIPIRIELPRINEKFLGLKYKYAYGVGGVGEERKFEESGLVKVNVDTKETAVWSDSRYMACEPVFVPAPGATEEDDGVILSPILRLDDSVNTALLVLDARNMTEIARAEIPSNILVPYSFHGIYSNKL